MRVILFVLSSVLLIGCGGKPPRPTPPPPKYDGISLTISCPDASYRSVVEREVFAWGVTNGVKVSVQADLSPEADIVVQAPSRFGVSAAKGEYRSYPQDLRSAGHAGQWLNIGEVYRSRMAAWGPQIYGVPLGTEAWVVVYRADKYADKGMQSKYQVALKKALQPPATWEDFAEQAEFFTQEDKQPALPAATGPELLETLHAMAACYEREATATLPKEFVELFAMQSLNFHHNLQTGSPRLRSAGFQAALQLLKKMQLSMGNGKDAFAKGQAVLAVVPLKALSSLQATSKLPFGILRLPGTRSYLDWRTNRMVAAKSGINFVPYLSNTGNVGAVTNTCKAPEAAFDLLSFLAGPTSTLKTIGDSTLGYGPWRAEHTAPTARGLWAGFNLDVSQTDQLLNALQPSTTINPVVTPRGPGADAMLESLARHLEKMVTGTTTVEDCVSAVETEWKTQDVKFNPSDLLKWRKQSAGLD